MKKYGVALAVLGITIIAVLLNFEAISYYFQMNTLLKKGKVNEKFIEKIYNKEGGYRLLTIVKDLDFRGQKPAGDKILQFVYSKYKNEGKNQQEIEIFLTDININYHKEVIVGIYKEILDKKRDDIEKAATAEEKTAAENSYLIYLQTLPYDKALVAEGEKLAERKTEKTQLENIYKTILLIHRANGQEDEVKRIADIMKAKIGEDSIKIKK